VVPELHSLRAPGAPWGPGSIPASELESLAPGLRADAAAPVRPFGSVLGSLVGEVSAKQSAAGDAVAGLLSGRGVPLHQAMIAMEEASVSFQLMVEVRNKLMESYQELMRMQV
jgi:flagellar hook-basal body complex protein FliE